MTFDELLRLLKECHAPHLKLFVILAISTGARKTAILELTWDQVDLEKRVIDFRVDRDQEDILDSGGMKGRAVVDMGQTLYDALMTAKRWRTTNHVIEYNGKPVQDVHKALKAAMQRAGIDSRFFGAHAIRHSVATLIADAGVELRRIQRLLGHEDFGTTDKIYAAHSRGYLSEVVNVVDSFLNGHEPGGKPEGAEILQDGNTNEGSSGSLNPGVERQYQHKSLISPVEPEGLDRAHYPNSQDVRRSHTRSPSSVRIGGDEAGDKLGVDTVVHADEAKLFELFVPMLTMFDPYADIFTSRSVRYELVGDQNSRRFG